jgi:hypothetical protein
MLIRVGIEVAFDFAVRAPVVLLMDVRRFFMFDVFRGKLK